MPAPKTVLPLLIGGAIGAAGIIQGLHWRSTAPRGDVGEIENQLRIAGEENELLRRENESLRSLAQGGGEVAVPPELVERVEKEYGLRFKSSPVVHKIGRDELRDRISASIESHFGPGGLDYRQEAYRLIGWLLPDDNLLQQLTAVRSVGARSWFDDETGEAWVTDRFRIENIPDQAALLRVVSRILLHQNFPPSEEYPGDDASRSIEALFQGAASAGEAKYYAEKARNEGFTPLTDQSEAENLLRSLSPFIQGLTTFPAVEGSAYVGALKSLGPGRLAEAFASPPRTTRAIFQPAEDRTAPPILDMPEPGGEPFMSDSAGELGLRLWILALEDPELALEISSAWRNDRYVFFPEGDTKSAVMWDVVLESKDAADRFQGAALDMIAAMAGRDDTAPPATPVETLDKRWLMISRIGPDRVRFLNTAGRETAEKLK